MLKAALGRSRKGFSLLELIVVVVILGLLAALAIPTFSNVLIKTKDQRSIFELQGVSREAVAVSAFDGDGDRSTSLRTWLASGKGDSSAMSAGTQAAASVSLSSVAWKSSSTPTDLTDSELSAALGDVSDEYGFFSVSVPNAGEEFIGMAMRSAYPGHCVFATFDASTGAAYKSTVKDWAAGDGADSCRASNAVGMVDGGGTEVPTGLVVVEDTINTTVNTLGSVKPLTNDSAPSPMTLVDVGDAAHGVADFEGDTITYQPKPDFVGDDSFTYAVSAGEEEITGLVVVHVTESAPSPVTECAAATVSNSWFPLGTAETGTCLSDGDYTVGITPVPNVNVVTSPPGETPGDLPFTGGPVDAGELGKATSLTSFPHSDLNYPHFVFGTSANGGLFWVKDTGIEGVNADGCATAESELGNCDAGWLFAPGTFSNPTVAITGQGPGHGDIRAEFNYDTMFVADDAGIWSASVAGFTNGSAPTLIASSGNLNGTVAMTGYACFDAAGTKIAGDCLWVLTSNATISQVNINTGEVRTVPLTGTNSISSGTSIQAITFEGQPQFVIGDSYGTRMRYNTQGVAQGGRASNDTLGAGVTTVVGSEVYHAGSGALTASPLAQSGGANQVTSRVVKSVLNPDGTRTFSWTYDGVNPSAGWSLYIIHQASFTYAVTEETYQIPAGSKSVTISPQMNAAISGVTQGYRITLTNKDTNTATFNKYESYQSLVARSEAGFDSSVVTPGNATYTSETIVDRTFNNSITALHSHGVPDQVYMAVSDGCVRKANGDDVYTLWCDSSDTGTLPVVRKAGDIGDFWNETAYCEARNDGLYCGGETSTEYNSDWTDYSYVTQPVIKVSDVSDITRVQIVTLEGDVYTEVACYTREATPRAINCVDMQGDSYANYAFNSKVIDFEISITWGEPHILARLSDGSTAYYAPSNGETSRFYEPVEAIGFSEDYYSVYPMIISNGTLQVGLGGQLTSGEGQGSFTHMQRTPTGSQLVSGGKAYLSSYYSDGNFTNIIEADPNITGATKYVGEGCAIKPEGLVCMENGSPRVVSSVVWDDFGIRHFGGGTTYSGLWDETEGFKFLSLGADGIWSITDDANG